MRIIFEAEPSAGLVDTDNIKISARALRGFDPEGLGGFAAIGEPLSSTAKMVSGQNNRIMVTIFPKNSSDLVMLLVNYGGDKPSRFALLLYPSPSNDNVLFDDSIRPKITVNVSEGTFVLGYCNDSCVPFVRPGGSITVKIIDRLNVSNLVAQLTTKKDTIHSQMKNPFYAVAAHAHINGLIGLQLGSANMKAGGSQKPPLNIPPRPKIEHQEKKWGKRKKDK